MLTHSLSDVLRGVAYGDAIGYPLEFRFYGELTKANRRGPDLPEDFVISDDTQMALSLARGLDGARLSHEITSRSSRDAIEVHVCDEWITWFSDPDNDRAPGTTCMGACQELAEERPWWRATRADSNTCGSVMRFAAAAFLPEWVWQPVSAWQAASTHGGPESIASCVIATALLRRILEGKVTTDDSLLGEAITLTRELEAPDFVGWLGRHPRIDNDRDVAEQYFADGMMRVEQSLQHAADLLPSFMLDPWRADPSEDLAGWIAKEALSAALLCVDMLPGEPVEALRRAAVTGGDSDSIAAIAGAFLSGLHDDPWPADWFDRLEPRYRRWLIETEKYDYSAL